LNDSKFLEKMKSINIELILIVIPYTFHWLKYVNQFMSMIRFDKYYENICFVGI